MTAPPTFPEVWEPRSATGSSGAAPTACVWCGARLAADNASEQLTGRLRCHNCGAATTDPWPTESQLDAAYGSWYRPSGGARFRFGGDVVLARSRGLIAARLDRVAPPGPVLDVGAGEGSLLDALERIGREGSGLERSDADPRFRDESIEQVEAGWAAVVLWHALEHLPQPGEAVRAAAAILLPGGIIAVAVPNSSSLQARAFGDRWLHLDLPRHLSHLTTASLIAGLERSGFSVEEVSYVRSGQQVIGWLEGLVGLLPGRPSLYQALRAPAARTRPIGGMRRALTILAGAALLPLAGACAAVEIALRRGGTVYVEGRLSRHPAPPAKPARPR